MHDACAAREILNRGAVTPLREVLCMLLRIVAALGIGIVGGMLGAALYRNLSHLEDSDEEGDSGMIPIEHDDGPW